MTEKYFRNEKTGRSAKITIFSKSHKQPGRYYVALFDKEQLSTNEGWYTNNRLHAESDAKNWVKQGEKLPDEHVRWKGAQRDAWSSYNAAVGAGLERLAQDFIVDAIRFGQLAKNVAA